MSRIYNAVGKFIFDHLRGTGWTEVCLNCMNNKDYLPRGMKFRMVGMLPYWFGSYRCKSCYRMVRYRERMIMSTAVPFYKRVEK